MFISSFIRFFCLDVGLLYSIELLDSNNNELEKGVKRSGHGIILLSRHTFWKNREKPR
jgi:hypothetical protein